MTLEKSKNVKNVTNLVHEIKNNNPNYPVYKSFRLLNEKNGKKLQSEQRKKRRGTSNKSRSHYNETTEDVNQMKHAMWTEKYKPKSSDDIIGNAEAVKKLATWLGSWKRFNQEKKIRRNSSSSEFEITDYDSRDSNRLQANTIILGGPCGSGKSAAVYALCNQLDFNVIELNASSKRSGKNLKNIFDISLINK